MSLTELLVLAVGMIALLPLSQLAVLVSVQGFARDLHEASSHEAAQAPVFADAAVAPELLAA